MTRQPLRRPRRRRGGGVFAAFVVLALGAVAVGLFVRAHRQAAVRPLAGSFQLAVDSLKSASARGDWAAASQWAERLAAEQPRNTNVLFELARTLHNRATTQSVTFGRPRPALRTSLERIGTERRVMALLDSAAALAPNPAEWARARYFRGLAYENWGLPLEAYQYYVAVDDSVPTFADAAARSVWLRAYIMNPQHPEAAENAAPPPQREPAPQAAPPLPDAVPDTVVTPPAP